MLLLDLSFWEEALRGLCAWLCDVIYPVISAIYELFMVVVTADFLTTSTVEEIYQRITMILSIIMVFYVTFEFVKFVVEPDGITDKDKGVGKIVYKMVAVIILLAFVPKIFTLGYKFQGIVLNNQIISKVILGKVDIDNKTFGNNFSADILNRFYYKEGSVKDDEECVDGIACADIVTMNLGELRSTGKIQTYNLKYGINETIDDTETPMIHFDAILAVIVGGILVYILLTYCIGAGVRYVQMLYLQIIAPIPIIGYLSVKKDGMFEKWGKQCIVTYIDIFIRISILYFIVLIANILGEMLNKEQGIFPGVEPGSFMETLAYVTIILGLLIFAKKMPKLLEELFPKMSAASGDFGLSGENAKMVAKGAGLALGTSKFLGGAVARGANTYRRNKENGKKSIFTKEGRQQRKEAKERRDAARNMPRERRKAEKEKQVIDERDAALKNLKETHEARKKAEAEGKPQGEIAKLKAKETEAIARAKKANENYSKLVNPSERKTAQINAAKAKEENAKKALEQAKQTGDQAQIDAAQKDYDDAQKDLKAVSGTGIKDADTNVQIEKSKLASATAELEQAKQTGDQTKIDEAQKKVDSAQESLRTAESYSNDLKKKFLENVGSQSVQENNAKMLEENNIEKQQALESQIAEDQNKKYRSVVGSAVVGGAARAFRAAQTGITAEKLSDVSKKVNEGVQKDMKVIAANEKYYDEGGTGTVDRFVQQQAKKIGVTTSYQQTQSTIRSYDNKMKANESLSKIEGDVKTRVDTVKDRGKNRLDNGKLKNVVTQDEVNNNLRFANDDKTNLVGCNTLNDVYDRYCSAAELAQSKADAATKYYQQLESEGKDSTEAKKMAEKASLEAQQANNRRTQAKDKISEYAFTQILQSPNPEENSSFDGVMVQQVKDMKKSIEVARSNPQTVDSFSKIYTSETPEYQAFISGNFANFGILDNVQRALKNIADERLRENMGLSESKRKLEASSRTDAQKAASEYNSN